MRNNKLIIGAVVAVAALIAILLIAKTVTSKPKAKKAASSAVQARKDMAKAPAKKVFSKGRGGLTVKLLNSKGVDIPMRIKAFRVADQRSSVYAASSVGGRMQELASGAYDIEVDTVPQKIFKNIKVEQGKETVEDLGCVTGSLIIKTVNFKKTAAFYPLRILYPKTGDMVTAFMTNKVIEIIPGTYDIEVGISPKILREGVKVDAGKDVVVDLGCITGSLLVKVVDENNKDIRVNARVMRSDTGEMVSSALSNRPIELGKGSYNVEIFSNPRQTKKDVKVELGQESVAEFTASAQQPVRKSAPAAPKRIPAKPRVVKPQGAPAQTKPNL